MHVGTFTPEGTYAAAAEQLPELARLGITVIELMPLADFSGEFGWGYDGVCLCADAALRNARRLAASYRRAHVAGIGVILDVVYNHFGPGQTMEQFSDYYLSKKYSTDWGKALNFDGPESAGVRQFVLSNVAYWINEYHFDGLRLDATQDIHDTSDEHILTAIARTVRAAAKERETLIIAENEPQHSHLVRPPEQGGSGIDALWNDDFHHAAVVALSGRHEAYYTDYRGTPQEFISAAKYGYLYQGQWYRWQGKNRGRPGFDLPPAAFVNFLQNHDQVANSLRGARLHTLASPGCYRAMTALLLLGPNTPMLFQGQEFASSRPFLYFADRNEQDAKPVRQGRMKFLAQFPSIAGETARAAMPDPNQARHIRAVQARSLPEGESHHEAYAAPRSAATAAATIRVFSERARRRRWAQCWATNAFVLRFFGATDDDRILIVNLGSDLPLSPVPEPLLSPRPATANGNCSGRATNQATAAQARRLWCSGFNWTLPGYSATVMRPT